MLTSANKLKYKKRLAKSFTRLAAERLWNTWRISGIRHAQNLLSSVYLFTFSQRPGKRERISTETLRLLYTLVSNRHSCWTPLVSCIVAKAWAEYYCILQYLRSQFWPRGRRFHWGWHGQKQWRWPLFMPSGTPFAWHQGLLGFPTILMISSLTNAIVELKLSVWWNAW